MLPVAQGARARVSKISTSYRSSCSSALLLASMGISWQRQWRGMGEQQADDNVDGGHVNAQPFVEQIERAADHSGKLVTCDRDRAR
jgi:hypothetical protein